MSQIQIQIWREEYNELLREKEAIKSNLNSNIGKKQVHIQKLKEINKKINYYADIISKTLMNSYEFPFVVDVEDLDSNFKYKKCDFEFRRRPIITTPQNRRQKQKDSDVDETDGSSDDVRIESLPIDPEIWNRRSIIFLVTHFNVFLYAACFFIQVGTLPVRIEL